jgi:hypothetical protein
VTRSRWNFEVSMLGISLVGLILGAAVVSSWATTRLSQVGVQGLASAALAIALGVLVVFAASVAVDVFSGQRADSPMIGRSSLWMIVFVVLALYPVVDLQRLALPATQGLPVGLLQIALGACLLVQALRVALWRVREVRRANFTSRKGVG